jgi:hypothetical protein
MKTKLILLLFCTIFLLNFVSSEKVGVVITFPDNSIYAQCLDVSEDTSGFDLLNELSLKTTWSDVSTYGHQLCQINNVGDEVSGNYCSYNGKYWGFFKEKGNDWQYLPVGFDAGDKCWNNDLNSYLGHYCTKEGDLIGLRYGEYGEIPEYYSFDDICSPLNLKDVKVYVDDKREGGVNENGGEIEAKAGSKISFKIELENNYLFDEEFSIEDVKAKITFEDIRESEKFKDLDFEENDLEKMEIVLPLNLSEGDYEIELEISGEDTNNIEHEINIDYDLEIIKGDEYLEELITEEVNTQSNEFKEDEKSQEVIKKTPLIYKNQEIETTRANIEESFLKKNIVVILLIIFLLFLMLLIILITLIIRK